MRDNKPYLIFVFFFWLVIPAVSAVTLNNAVIESSGLDTTINVAFEWTFDELKVENGYILFSNLSYTNSLAEGQVNITSLNYTQTNKRITSNDFPYVSNSLSDNQVKHIYNNISQTVDASVVFDVTSCDIERITYQSHSGAYSKTYSIGEWTCTSNLVTLSVTGIETATNSNNIIITYSSGVVGGGGTGGVEALEEKELTLIEKVIKPMLPFWRYGLLFVMGVIILLLLRQEFKEKKND